MSDAANRRNILHDLQQTKTRLQKLQEERPSKLNSAPTPSPVLPVPQRPPTTTPPPASIVLNPQQDSLFISKQQKAALQQASTQSHGYYVTQPSTYGNLIIPVLPRFNDKGHLLPMI